MGKFKLSPFEDPLLLDEFLKFPIDAGKIFFKSPWLLKDKSIVRKTYWRIGMADVKRDP